MLSWITGPRITDAADIDVHGFEPSVLEPPQTPAPVFAMNAFKYALFGTPAAGDVAQKQSTSSQCTSTARFQTLDDRAQKSRSKDFSSPTKPMSILITPGGMVNGRRKNVTFGSGVVDNEGKKDSQLIRDAVSTDCPDKSPNPYTSKKNHDPEHTSRSNLTASLHAAKSKAEAEPPSRSVKRSKDDSEITLDMSEPRSQSGRYWKETHEAYAAKSERETRKLIAKHKLAKDFAKKKDAEAAEARLKLDSERKKHQVREKNWETSTRDLQERLRKAVAENAMYAAELALMRQRMVSAVAEADTLPLSLTQSHDAVGSSAASRLTCPEHAASQARQSSSPQSSTIPLPTKAAPSRSNVAELPQQIKTSSPDLLLASAPESSDPMASLTQDAGVRSSEQQSLAWHVSKRPVTITTTRVRNAQHEIPRSAEPEMDQVEATVKSAQIAIHEDSDIDLWAISNLEVSNMDGQGPQSTLSPHDRGRQALGSRTANNTMFPTPKAASSKSPAGDKRTVSTQASDQAPRPADFNVWGSGIPDEQENTSHFPGSPVAYKKQSESSLATAKTSLPLTREEQARQRVLARRASRKTRGE